jgi:hypothetical protein
MRHQVYMLLVFHNDGFNYSPTLKLLERAKDEHDAMVRAYLGKRRP